MSTYLGVDQVHFLCSCEKCAPLCRLYFCRHCLELKCFSCVSHEVDSHYCPNCLENMASAEAKMRQDRCGNCFDCPSCGHTLSTRATVLMVPKSDEPGSLLAQKVYYLSCGFCRWTTRDAGVEDKRQPTGGWQETVNPYSKRIENLIESYRQLALREKSERDRTKYVRKRNYLMLLERFPVLAPQFRRYCSPSWAPIRRDQESSVEHMLPAADPFAEPDNFDVNDFIKKPFRIEQVNTLIQRHLAPQLQPIGAFDLEPRHKALVVKRSMRCRRCEHNMSKADFNPSSIKFRINLSALYHVPELRIIPPSGSGEPTNQILKGQEFHHGNSGDTNIGASSRIGSIKGRRSSAHVSLYGPKVQTYLHAKAAPDKTMQIILTLSNPAHRTTLLRLRQLTSEEEATYLAHLAVKPTHTNSPTGREDLKDKEYRPSAPVLFSTVKLGLPTTELMIAAHSDIPDYEDSVSAEGGSEFTDDPKVVAFRRSNKLGIYVNVTPCKPTSPLVEFNACNSNELAIITNPRSAYYPAKNLSPVSELPTTSPGDTELLVPLRAAIELTFDYKYTTSTLFRPASSTNTPASGTSAMENQGKSTCGPNQSGIGASALDVAFSEEIHQVRLVMLLELGVMQATISIQPSHENGLVEP